MGSVRLLRSCGLKQNHPIRLITSGLVAHLYKGLNGALLHLYLYLAPILVDRQPLRLKAEVSLIPALLVNRKENTIANDQAIDHITLAEERPCAELP